jgi:hypothetical protein
MADPCLYFLHARMSKKRKSSRLTTDKNTGTTTAAIWLLSKSTVITQHLKGPGFARSSLGHMTNKILIALVSAAAAKHTSAQLLLLLLTKPKTTNEPSLCNIHIHA